MNIKKFPLLKFLAPLALGLGGAILSPSYSAIASPSLTITPITWNIIGLDSNNVNVGPNTFLVGARVCNIGTSAATNVTASLVRDGTTNTFISFSGATTLSIPSLPAGSVPPSQYTISSTPTNCFDFYYNGVITRTSSAYNTTQRYYITATADLAGSVSTPRPRELYIEKLVSQNRNLVNSLTGPTTVVVGQTYQYTFSGKTATGGYEQLEHFPNFPNTVFQLIGVSTRYANPSGAVNSTIYADACGWTNDPTSTYYHNNTSCTDPLAPDNYGSGTGAKVGGDPITTTYTVKILSAGPATLDNIIYDYSGSSYHYNSDFGTGGRLAVTAINPPDLTITKSHTGNFVRGSTGSYKLTVMNTAAAGASATLSTVTVKDTLPVGLTPTAASGTGWICNVSGQDVTCTRSNALSPGASYEDINISVSVSQSATSSITNTAAVSGGGETNTTNNSASDQTNIVSNADLSISKTDNQTSATPGRPISYTITVSNSGPSNVTGATVTDTVPNTITGVTWNCTASSGSSCGAASGSGNAINTTANLLSGGTATYTVSGTVSLIATGNLNNTASVAVPAGVSDSNTTNNSATDSNTIASVSDLTIAKTHTGNFVRGSTGSYSIVVANSGSIATNGTVTVNDTLPAGLTLNGNPSGTGWICTATSTTEFSCTRLDILNAGSSYPAITASVNVAQTAANSVTNTAIVSGVGEANTNNNSASDPTNIISSADLGITKTDNQTATTAGSSISYTITVINNGPSTLNSVTVTDTVPSTIQNPVFTPSTGSYNSSTGAWTGLNLATGQSVTLTMAGTVSSTAAGTITNTAVVVVPSGVTDSNSTNNSATDTTNIYAIAPTAGKVIINEVLYAQTGATAATNDEFIEIYNASNASVDLSGWKLADGNLIENSTDGSGSITGSSTNPAYLFPSGTTLAPGQYAVIWIGSNTATNQASGATFQAWLGQPPGLNNTGDDVWLYDSQSRIVDYIAYGSGSAINTPPPASLNLWNTTYQTSLAGASTSQSISLTANGIDGNASACWEPTTSGQASTRCTSYLPTRDTDTVGVRVTTVGQNNNGALAPLMLLVKRITAINGSTNNLTGFIDDPSTTNDNSNEWPSPASSYLRGAINGGAIKPGDTVDYTIYYLSNGGSSAQKVNMCDLVPTNTSFVPDAFGNGLGIAQATGSAAPVNLTNTADTDGGLYINANGSLPTGVSCGASNTNGAVIVNLGNVPNATSAGTPTNSYGFIRFRVRVN